jgi:hypothetical protein
MQSIEAYRQMGLKKSQKPISLYYIFYYPARQGYSTIIYAAIIFAQNH